MIRKTTASILIICFTLPLQELYAQSKLDLNIQPRYSNELPSETTQRHNQDPKMIEYNTAVFNESFSLDGAIKALTESNDYEVHEQAMKTIRGLARGGMVEKNRSLAVHIIGELCIKGEQEEEDKKAISAAVAKGDVGGQQQEPYVLAITYSGACMNSETVDNMLYKLAGAGIGSASWIDDEQLEVTRAAIRGLAYSKGAKSKEYLRKLANQAIDQKSGYGKRVISLDENLGKLQGELAEQLAYKGDYDVLSNYISDKYAYGTPIEVDIGINTLYGDKNMKIASAMVMAAAGKCAYIKKGNSSSARGVLLKTVSNGLMDSGLELELRDAARSVLLGNCGCSTKYYMNNSTPYINCGFGQEVADYIDVAKYNERIQSYVNQAMIFVITWYTFDWAFLVAGKFIFQALKGISKMLQKAFPAIKTETTINKIVQVRKLKKTKVGTETGSSSNIVKNAGKNAGKVEVEAGGTTIINKSAMSQSTTTTTTNVVNKPIKSVTKTEAESGGSSIVNKPTINEPIEKMPTINAKKIEVVSSDAAMGSGKIVSKRSNIIMGTPDDLLADYRLAINKKNFGYEEGIFKNKLSTLPKPSENEVVRGMTIKNETELYKISEQGFLTKDVRIPRTRIGMDGRPDYSYEICFTADQSSAADYAFLRLSKGGKKDGEIIIVSYAKKDKLRWDYDAWVATDNIPADQITRNFLYKPGEGWVEISIDHNAKIIRELTTITVP